MHPLNEVAIKITIRNNLVIFDPLYCGLPTKPKIGIRRLTFNLSKSVYKKYIGCADISVAKLLQNHPSDKLTE
jgi:hypothetical protein